jgi:drug/metabolite transporter (DMT)-like permease
MVWFFLAFGAALFWALGHILLKRGFDHVPPLWNNILDKLISLILWTPIILFMSGFKIAAPPLSIAAVVIAAAALYHFFFYAISKGQISLTGTIVAGYPLFTILLSYFFLHEQLSPMQYAGITLILIGDVTVALPDKRAGDRNCPSMGHDYTWVLWGFVGALTLGVGDFLTKVSINRIGSYSHIFWLALIGNFVAGFNYLIDKRNRPRPPLLRRKGLATLLGIVVNLIGAFFFLLAFDYGKVSLIASVSSIYPAFMALLAVRFLHERISRKQGTGIAVAILGLVLIGTVTL